MCMICAEVLRRLVSRGLVSEGNVREQLKEMKYEVKKAFGVENLTDEQALSYITQMKSMTGDKTPGIGH